MLDLNLERKATDKEKAEAAEIDRQLEEAGYNATYSGGKKSKGHGFWVGTGEDDNYISLGWMSCAEAKELLL